MKKTLLVLIVAIATLYSCTEEKKRRGRIDYPLIKEKVGITGALEEQFDKITDEYADKGRQLFEENKKNNKETTKEERELIAQEQDGKIKSILTDEQYAIYAEEVKIERTGREKYNIGLIKEGLALDSTQSVVYDQTNAAFYKTLRDNHDSYHGKPDVYKQFYAELDINRKEALKNILSESQFQQYLELVEKYQIGKSGER
jgi:hypothetical protein